MRRAKEVQVVFKDCQDKDATEMNQHRKESAMEKCNGEEQLKRTMTKNAEDGAPAQDGRGVTAG